MNQNELLKMVRMSQDLVNGSIISTDLNSILIGICDLINIQNNEIEILKEKMSKREKFEEDLGNMKNDFEQKTMQMAQLQNQISIFANQTQTELMRSHQEIETIKTKLDEQFEESLEKIAESQKSSENQIHLLALKNNHSEDQIKKNIEEIAKQSEKLDFDLHDLKIQLNTYIMEQEKSKIELPIVVEKPKTIEVEKKHEEFDQSAFDSIRSQIDSIEEKIEKNQNSISEVHFLSQKSNNEIKMSEKRIQKLFNNETILLNDRISALEKQLQSVPEIQDLILSGKEIGLVQILQAIMRDSRRLDSFDQQVSSVRIECENVASGMVALSETVKKFNNQIFDFGREVKDNSNKIINDIELIKKFCKFLGKSVNNIVSDIAKITDGHHHLASTISLSADEISHLMSIVAGRRLKTLSLLDEINLEASDLSTDMNQKKIDLNMEKQIKLLEGEDLEVINDETLQKIDVPQYQKVIKPYKHSKSLNYYICENDECGYNEIANTKDYNINHIHILNLEELRVKVNDITDILVASNNSVNSKLEDMHKEIKKKMDSCNVDRLISKIQNLLKKIQTEIDQIKSQKSSLDHSSINKNENFSIKYSNTLNEKDIIFGSKSISTSTSIPLKSYQSSGMTRPNTAVTNSFLGKQIKKNYNDQNIQRKTKNKDLNNSIPIIQKTSSSKLASSVVSNPKDF